MTRTPHAKHTERSIPNCIACIREDRAELDQRETPAPAQEARALTEDERQRAIAHPWSWVIVRQGTARVRATPWRTGIEVEEITETLEYAIPKAVTR